MNKHVYKWMTHTELNKLLRAVKRKKLGFKNPVFDIEEVIASREDTHRGRNNRLLHNGDRFFHATLTYDT